MSNLQPNNLVPDEVESKGVSSERVDLAQGMDFEISNPSEICSIVRDIENPENTFLILDKQGEDNSKFTNSEFDNGPLSSSRVVVLNSSIPEGNKILAFSELLLQEIAKLSLKRITLIGIEDGANVAQALTILEPRLFRRAILIDPQSRAHPTYFTKLIDWIEQYLPVGLPFRALSKEFNSRPFVHRIRCPIMIVQSPKKDFYHKSEAQYLASKIPNCYLMNLNSNPFDNDNSMFSNEFYELLREFLDSPAKRPQKNL